MEVDNLINLYKKDETTFEHNGLGSLDNNILNPEINWKDNGAFTLEFKYPLFAKHGFEIENSSIVRANDPEGLNLFFVYKITPSMGYVTVLCYQISYKLAFNSINDTNIVNKSGQNALTQMSNATQYPHSFVFSSDIQTTATSRVVRKNPIEFLLDTSLDNSFVNRWGGHIVRHGFNIAMNSAYGSNKGYTIRHKKDLKGYEAEFDESTVITRIRPVGADGLLLPELYVDSHLIDNYVEPRIQEIEYSNVKVKTKDSDEEGFSTKELAYAELRRLAKLEFSKNKVDLPTFTSKVEFVNLKDTKEYQDLKSLKQILAGDIVKVIHSEDNFNIEAQMVEYKWNPLNNSYVSITLGNYTKSFTSTVSKASSLQTNLSQIAQQAQSAMTAANGKNTVYSLTYKPSITNSSVEGDLLYLKNGDKTELWILKLVDGKLQWVEEISDATQEELKAQMAQAKTDIVEAVDSANSAVDKANASVTAVQENTHLINDVNAIANNAKSQAQTAATNAQTALASANAAKDNANKAISDAGKLSEDVLALDTIANQAKSDADAALINANKGITDAKTALNKAIGVDTRVTTEITNVNNTLATKANSTTVDALSNTVSSQGTAISQNATDIKLKSDSTVVNAIKGTVDNQGTLISQNSKDIALKANKSSVDTLTGRVSANETAIDVTAQGVSTLVTKTDGTNTSLSQFKQDYEGFKGTVYTKSQTDTKVSTVQQSVDNFKTTVSNTYSSKSETDSKVTAVQANVDKLGTNIAYAWSQDGKNRFTRVKPGSHILKTSLIHYQPSRSNIDNSSLYITQTSIYLEKGKIYTIHAKATNGIPSNLHQPTVESDKVVLWLINSNQSINKVVSDKDLLTTGSTFTWNNADGEYYLRVNSYKTDNSIWVDGVEVVEGSTYYPNPQDDYDNAVPRYIGRSLKDSNSPSDYKWEPNPERKPWVSYAQGVNGEGFSLIPYGENQITSALNTLNWKVGGWSGYKSFSSDGKKLIITALYGWCATRFKVPDELIGKKLTLSFNAILDGAKTTATEYTLYLANGLSGKFNTTTIANTPDIPKDKLVRYSATFVMNETGFVGVTTNNAPENSGQTTVWTIDDIKLELANTMNIPTPWTPAPSEDPLGAIPKYVGTAALPYEDPYKYDWRLSSGWNQVKTSTEFEQTDKEIGLKADQTTVNAITGRVSTAEGSITTMAGQVALKANKTEVDTLSGRVSATESSLKIQDGKITALNTKADGHTTQIGTLESSYNGLTSTISKIQTDVGGKAGKTELSQLSQDLSGFKTTVSNTYADKVSVASQITQSATAVTSNVQSWTNNKLTAYSTTQQTATSITNAVASKADKTQITQLSDNINLKVSKGDVTSQINLEAGRTLIDTKQLLLNADTVKFTGSAFIPNSVIQNLSADKITAGTLNAANVNVINLNAKSLTAGTISGNNLSLNLDTGAVQFQKGYIAGNNSKIRFDLDKNYFQSLDFSNNGFVVSDGSFTFYQGFFGSTETKIGGLSGDIIAEKGGIILHGVGGASLSSDTYKASVDVGSAGLGTGNGVSIMGDTRFWGGISVLGKKNAIHVTRDGVRETPAYETAESYLGDIGGNYTRENCEVWVDIEKLFSDTVNTDIAYHVFLQAYDDARFWVEDFRSDKFLIKSDKPMARFAWEIKAKRRGYENDRLVIQEGVDNKVLLEAHSEGIFKGDGENE